jgi:type IV pilus assembly protein PilC
MYRRLLRVGEATGGLPFTLQQLTENMQRRKTVADRVKKALVYPAISLAVAFGAAYVLVTYSLPSLTSLLREFGGELPIATKVLIAVSDALQAYALYFIGPLAGLAVVSGALMRTAPVRLARDHILLRIPVVGGILLGSNLFFLTTTIATLLRGGIPPIEALNLTEQGLSNAVVRARLARVTKKASEGTRLGEAFEEEKGFPSILAQAVATGEMRGSIVEPLSGLAEYYEDVTDRAVSGATELIQPAVILIVAGIVGFVAIAVISGIYSTLGSVG